MKLTPADIGIAEASFASIAEEMGELLTRSGFSPNIKERRDHSCGLFDSNGNLVAQAAHIPVHLGAMPVAVRTVMEMSPFNIGDVVTLNDPYKGGNHLPDITTVAPIFANDAVVAYAATRAHHADIGGLTPGSNFNGGEFRGGYGATGGDGGVGQRPGGGGSGYIDGSFIFVSTTQGGSTSDAKVVIRVVT